MTARDRLSDWWDVVVLDRRDRARDWWDVAVVDRRDRARDQWGQAVLDRRDGLAERGGVAWPPLAAVVILAAAMCGTGLALALTPSGTAAPVAPAAHTSAVDPLLQRLPAVAERLAANRTRERRRLAAASTARGQAAAAAALSAAYRRAASTLAPAGRRAAGVGHTLRRAGAAYEALGRAAVTGHHGVYSSARRRVRVAEARLRRALDGVTTMPS
jgi:hypothetical protein